MIIESFNKIGFKIVNNAFWKILSGYKGETLIVLNLCS